MARPEGSPAGEPIPIRSLDQAGALTAAFNLLVDRFAAAERSYRADLRQAAEGARERSVFLAGLSHELRTPLNAILGYSEMLQEEAVDIGQDYLVNDLKKIHSAGKHLLNLINDVLDLSKIEAGRVDLHRIEFNLWALVQDSVALFRARCEQKPLGIRVDWEVRKTGICESQGSSERQMVRGDAAKLRQVLINLLGNAVKFTESVFRKSRFSSLTLLYKQTEYYRWDGCKRIRLVIQQT
jgi:signal transduction histidine kinase